MAEKRRGLGRGIGALFPTSQEEVRNRPIDIFFSNPHNASADDSMSEKNSQESAKSATARMKSEAVEKSDRKPGETSASEKKQTNVSRETFAGKTAKEKQKSSHASTTKRVDSKQLSKNNKSARQDDQGSIDSVAKGETVGNSVDTAKNGRVDKPVDNTVDKNVDDELQTIPGATFGELLLDEIIPNMQQPRQVFDEDDLAELAASIREVGVLQPIVVRPLTFPVPEHPEVRYELIMGERRWRASRLAGNESVPAIVRQTDTDDMLRDALLENLHRVQLNALEEAAAYQQLMEDFNYTQEELSRKIARSRPQISNTLRLLKLPPLVQRRVAAGVISAGHARALLGLSDAAAMERLAQRIVAENLSVRVVEELVSMGADDTPEKHTRTQRTKRYQSELNGLAVRLMDRFETKVKVVMGQKKGRISIDFGSIEDLNRILDLIDEDNVNVSRETSAE